MALSIPLRSRQPLLLVIGLAALAGIVVGAAVMTTKRPLFLATSAATANAAAPAQQDKKTKVVAGVSVNLTRFGFEPSEIIIPKGRYFLSVRDLTGPGDTFLTLARSNNQNLKLIEEPYKKGSRGWDKLLDLTPGDYVIGEKHHPQWTLKITVRKE